MIVADHPLILLDTLVLQAWQLELQFPDDRFDAIVWNHPHLGVEVGYARVACWVGVLVYGVPV